MSMWETPFVPKSGRTLKVVGICRISTTHQDPRSLADQEAYYRRWLEENVHVPWELEIIASQGSGENLERAAYLDLVERTAEFDLVLTEDLGRICRRVHAHVEAVDKHCTSWKPCSTKQRHRQLLALRSPGIKVCLHRDANDSAAL